ncbi:VCBS repeat-containing protein [Acidobacteriia bacterium AH_259_A11_L15]|nr:VCBS repeat-containing protein [Acidobacteriia bacterium AH_259_A11_L15]
MFSLVAKATKDGSSLASRIGRGLFSLALVAAATAFAQQPPLATEPVPALEEQGPPQNAVEALLQKVETSEDSWDTELYSEEIGARLGQLKKLLAHAPLDPEKLGMLVAPEFRGVRLTANQRRRVRRKPPTVVLYEYEAQSEESVRARDLPGEFERWLGDWEELSHAEMKITGIRLLGPEPPRVEVEIRFDLTGRTEEGEQVQVTGHWRTQWRKDPELEWLLTQLEPLHAWESRSPQPLFQDITSCVLPEGEARQQLLRGVDWWTANLDAALEMDVAGYQGLSMGDVDGDGLEDFYVCQPSGLPNRLFRSNGDGTFSEISTEARVDVLDRTWGSVFFDYDNDGDQDLLVVGAALLLFRNDGTGHFEIQNPKQVGLLLEVETGGMFTSVCVADYNRDGWLDVYVCSYIYRVGLAGHRFPVPVYDANNGAPNFLFRNNGDGTFTNVTEEVGLDENNTRFSLACAWGDYDRDGWPDLYVANDFGRNNFYRNERGYFRDVAAELGMEDIGAGMSVAWEDYDNDGWLDLYVGNMWSSAGLRVTMQGQFKPESKPHVRASYRKFAKGNTLFRNKGDGTFEDVTDQAGVGLGRWAWSSTFFDLDLDGFEDIYVVNGFVTNENPKDL